MSQLGVNGPFLLSQIVNFVILYLLLSRFVFPPVRRMLDERKQRIADGLAAAEVARKEADEERKKLMSQIEAERADAQKRIAEASAQAERVRADILAEARREAEGIKAKAVEEAEAEKQRILADANKQIAELTVLATERVVRRGLDDSMQRQLIDDFLSDTSLN
ncbi:MAG: F0F1 ATP synthase subunit B [Caldilineales bacterium]|nr:F0F1 ATP synthase subunit B [Caldilineales bacterium]